MIRRRVLLAILLFSITAAAQTGWKLVWSDEFTGPANTPPDATKWARDLGGGGWGNQELETYTNSIDNAHLDGNGNLVITALQPPGGGYTSARLKTQGNFSTTYGRIEARIKIPYGQGLWPAFWMLGDNINTVSWPNCGEVDIMENIGKEPSIVHGTVHGPGYSGANGITAQYALPSGKFADDFHIFEVIWTTTSVEFFVDSKSYSKVTTASLPAGTQWVFNHGFFLLLNVAVGGGWPGNPDGTTTFPQSMTVDYVRVYQPDVPPAISNGGIVNAASFATPIAPGSLASIFGSGLADDTAASLFDSTAGAFTQTAEGSSVLVNGKAAPLTYVSPGQINFQVPWSTPLGTGVTVQVSRNGVTSNVAPIAPAATAPSAFYSGGTAIVSCAGVDCTLWGNGFGSVSQIQQDGVPSPPGIQPTNNACSLTINGSNAVITYCGAAPGLVIDQLNFRYPAGLPSGGAPLPASLTVGSSTIALQLPGLP